MEPSNEFQCSHTFTEVPLSARDSSFCNRGLCGANHYIIILEVQSYYGKKAIDI